MAAATLIERGEVRILSSCLMITPIQTSKIRITVRRWGLIRLVRVVHEHDSTLDLVATGLSAKIITATKTLVMVYTGVLPVAKEYDGMKHYLFARAASRAGPISLQYLHLQSSGSSRNGRLPG